MNPVNEPIRPRIRWAPAPSGKLDARNVREGFSAADVSKQIFERKQEANVEQDPIAKKIDYLSKKKQEVETESGTLDSQIQKTKNAIRNITQKIRDQKSNPEYFGNLIAGMDDFEAAAKADEMEYALEVQLKGQKAIFKTEMSKKRILNEELKFISSSERKLARKLTVIEERKAGTVPSKVQIFKKMISKLVKKIIRPFRGPKVSLENRIAHFEIRKKIKDHLIGEQGVRTVKEIMRGVGGDNQYLKLTPIKKDDAPLLKDAKEIEAPAIFALELPRLERLVVDGKLFKPNKSKEQTVLAYDALKEMLGDKFNLVTPLLTQGSCADFMEVSKLLGKEKYGIEVAPSASSSYEIYKENEQYRIIVRNKFSLVSDSDGEKKLPGKISAKRTIILPLNEITNDEAQPMDGIQVFDKVNFID